MPKVRQGKTISNELTLPDVVIAVPSVPEAEIAIPVHEVIATPSMPTPDTASVRGHEMYIKGHKYFIHDLIREKVTKPLDIRYVEGVRGRQDLVRNFLLENSPTFADFPMCRMLPIFIYADKPPDEKLIEAWVADFGFKQLDILPPLYGSWFGGFFATDHEALTFDQFWIKHPRINIATDLVNRLGLLGASVAVAGMLVSHTSPIQHLPVDHVTLQTPASQSVPQATPPPSSTITINIYTLTNNIGPLTQAKTSDEALKIIQAMAASATKPSPAKKAHKSTRTSK